MNYEDNVVANVWDAVGISVELRPEFRTELERRLVQRWGSGQAKWKEGSCKICGATIANPRQVAELFGQEMVFTFGCCDQCTEVRDAHYQRGRTQTGQKLSMTPQWDEQCPELYKELIDNLPPAIDEQAFAQVRSWMPTKGGKGLILAGNSGKGKTTSLWALFRQLEKRETNAVFLTAVELQRQLSEAARDIKGVKHLTHCRVLIIDDLGKEKLTASVAALLWEVVDSRYANRRPLVISTRYASHAFEERFGDSVLGKDIRRRLIDCCQVVQFRGLDGSPAEQTQP